MRSSRGWAVTFLQSVCEYYLQYQKWACRGTKLIQREREKESRSYHLESNEFLRYTARWPGGRDEARYLALFIWQILDVSGGSERSVETALAGRGGQPAYLHHADVLKMSCWRCIVCLCFLEQYGRKRWKDVHDYHVEEWRAIATCSHFVSCFASQLMHRG